MIRFLEEKIHDFTFQQQQYKPMSVGNFEILFREVGIWPGKNSGS